MSFDQALPDVVTVSVVGAAPGSSPFQLKSEHGVFLGRSSNCGLRLSGADVSEMHCYLKFESGKLWVEDWMSKTGTRVNGLPISERVAVQLGDTVEVGSNKIVFRAAAHASPARVVHPPASLTTNLDEPAAASDVSPASDNWFDSNLLEPNVSPDCDDETVALLRCEIEQLQAALAQRDADSSCDDSADTTTTPVAVDQTDHVLVRMQQLIDEADRSDERVAVLEEMLLAAEQVSRFEQEQRSELEAWINEIEQRIAEREQEQQAELNSLRQRLEQSDVERGRLIQQLRHATGAKLPPEHDVEQLADLQRSHRQLEEQLAEAHKQCAALQQRLEQLSAAPQQVFRQERAELAEEYAKIAKLRLAVSSQRAAADDLPITREPRRSGADDRITALREHLREIHDQERQETKSASLAGRLARLWQRVQ